MSPQKQVGYRFSKPFQGGFYARNIEDVTLTEDSNNSSLKVFASSNELGLYGAYRSACNVHFSGMISSGSLLLAGIFIGILILIIVITGLTYVLLTIILGATTHSERDSDGGVVMDETYVDRDYFGRKQDVHLDVGSHAGSSNASSYYETSQQSMIGMENMEPKPSGEGSASFWKSSSGPRHTIDEERSESEGRINKKDSN